MKPLFSIDHAGNVIGRPRTPVEDRELLLHCAKVYLREAQAQRARDPRFAATLMTWAANNRREASAIDVRQQQRELGL